MKSPSTLKHDAARIEDSLSTIQILAEILLNNGGYKGEPESIDIPPQITDRGESGIQQAIQLLADHAQRDFRRLADDLGIPA